MLTKLGDLLCSLSEIRPNIDRRRGHTKDLGTLGAIKLGDVEVFNDPVSISNMMEEGP